MGIIFTIMFVVGAIITFRKTSFSFGVPILGRMIALSIGGLIADILTALLMQAIAYSGWIYLAVVVTIMALACLKASKMLKNRRRKA